MVGLVILALSSCDVHLTRSFHVLDRRNDRDDGGSEYTTEVLCVKRSIAVCGAKPTQRVGERPERIVIINLGDVNLRKPP